MMQGAFEAKKHAVRQTQDGWVVSFVVHPNDINADFATAPLGTRYMVGFSAIGNDEQPIPLQGHAAAYAVLVPQPASADPLSTRSEAGKQRYASASDMEKALIRAARLPDDVRFRVWLESKGFSYCGINVNDAIQFIRETCCAGKSRKLIAEDRDCYDAFLRMETSYLIEAGILAEPR